MVNFACVIEAKLKLQTSLYQSISDSLMFITVNTEKVFEQRC